VADVGADSDEQPLEQALIRRGSIDFVEIPLHKVVTELSRQFQVPIFLSPKKLEEASVSPDTPITKQLQRLPLESILRLLLAELELDFTVRDNVILISTPEDIESRLETRAYPVLDLATPRRLGSKDVRFAAADCDSLIDLITSTIQPDSWDDVGGPASIEALDNAGAVVVSQTHDVHRQIESLLNSLRRAKTAQGIPSLPIPGLVSQRAAPPPISRQRRRTSPTPVQPWQLPRVYPEK
jgi:hypothetical protein